MSIQLKSGHGGERAGAGRKPKPQSEKRVTVSFATTPGNALYLRALPRSERSALLTALVIDYINNQAAIENA